MNQAPRQTLTAPIRRIRFAYVALIFCAWTAIIALRLCWLQVVRHSDFVHRAAMQQQRTFEVAPRRGVLYDRNLRELAVTVQVREAPESASTGSYWWLVAPPMAAPLRFHW